MGFIDQSYLIKWYIIGFIILVLAVFGEGAGFDSSNTGYYFYILSCVLLYPFAMFIYDLLIGRVEQIFSSRNHFIYYFIEGFERKLFFYWMARIIYTLLKVILLWAIAPFIAPFSILFIYMNVRTQP